MNIKSVYQKIIAGLVTCCLLFGVIACQPSLVGNLDDDDEWNSFDWDSITVSAYDDISYLEDIIYDICLYDINVNSIQSVEVVFIEQKDISEYFDEDKIYEQFGLNLNVNELLAKFAIGTGVIVICLVLNVVTMGASQPIVCMAAGALNGAVTGAASGAIFGGLMGGITNFIASNGDFSEALSGMIEGAVDGYMWGAIFGAITGAINSNYCFTAGTKVKTAKGYSSIERIEVGDSVYSYNHKTNQSEVKRVVNVFENRTKDLTIIHTGKSVIQSTPSHPFYINGAYKEIHSAQIGDSLFSYDKRNIDICDTKAAQLEDEIKVYNFEVEDNHNYYVGEDEILVHNTCINENYADKTYNFESQLNKAQSTNNPNDWKIYNDLRQKYPNGVPFVKDVKGNVFPSFDEYVKLQYKFAPVSKENLKAGTCLNGDSTASSVDFMQFRQRMLNDGYTKQQISELLSTHTIHHHPDMQTLQLIPRDVHQAARHTGGASLIRSIINLL